MLPLNKNLEQKKNSLQEFIELCQRILSHLPNVISGSERKGMYKIYSSNIAGTLKYVRPINEELFIENENSFDNAIEPFKNILLKIRQRDLIFHKDEKKLLDSFLYTIQQSIGVGLDLLVDPNSSRKHVGNRFEELMKCFFTEINVLNKKVTIRIPYSSDTGDKYYVCENDLILSNNEQALTLKHIEENEVVVSVKTTSKDRMGKMFIDKLLFEKFTEKKLKVIGIFLNGVQRKENNNISFTLVSELFMVYNTFLTKLEGVYYLDPPPNANVAPFNAYIKSFSELATHDVFHLLAPQL